MKIIRKQSKYNDIVVLETVTWGKALILNDELQSTERDQHIYHQALCFPAMQPAAKKILVLGAGEGSTARMILQSSPDKQVVMVEIDQMVIDVCREHIPSMGGTVWDNPRLHLIIGDAFTFVEECAEKFDVVVSDLSSPSPDSTSDPLYRDHFYGKVKNILKPNGMFVMQGTHDPKPYMKDFEKSFKKPSCWSEWIPSFGVPWYFIGGVYESKIILKVA